MNIQNKTRILLSIAILAMAVFASTAAASLPEPTGINPQTGLEWANGDQYRLAFITSSNPEGAQDPNIAYYNGYVQSLAEAAGLGEAAWYCIGSTGSLDAEGGIDARDNTSTNPEDPNDPNCPIYLVDAITLVAVDNPALWDGVIEHVIDQSETGGAPDPHGWAFTGTYKDGTAVTPEVSGGGPLGSTGEVSQCKAGAVDGWIWYQKWLSDSAATPNCLYAMSEALFVGGIDPNAPTVYAGPDMITWSDKLVPMAPTVVNKLEPTPIEYAWVAETTDTNVDIVLTPNSGDPLVSTDPAPTVTITKNDIGDDPVTVKVTLTVNNQGSTNHKSDFLLIDVYDDACDAANAVAPVTYDPSDINQDCNVDLKDFAEMALTWLNDYSLEAPMPKP